MASSNNVNDNENDNDDSFKTIDFVYTKASSSTRSIFADTASGEQIKMHPHRFLKEKKDIKIINIKDKRQKKS